MKGTILTARLPQYFRQHKLLWSGIGLLLILVSIISWYIKLDAPLNVVVDGRNIAVIENETVFNDALAAAKTEIEKEYGIKVDRYSNTVTLKDDKAEKKDLVEDKRLSTVLKEALDWQAECWSIKINGKPALCMKTEDEAKLALERVKEHYLPEDASHVEVEDIAIAEEYGIVKETAPLASLLTVDTAVESIVKGLDKIVQHTVVKGDTLWAIARDNEMSVEALKEINPDLKSDFLQLGQILNLVKVEPLLTVVTTVKATVEENISFKTVYESDNSLWRGQQSVIQQGQYGKREVIYRITRSNGRELNKEVLQETVLEEPVTRVVKQGTKMMVASRGAGGSGVVGWPLRGRITSPFGKYRGSWGTHDGLDIDGNIGDPVLAAEDGVVIENIYKGAYGRHIIIDHGDGLSTLYAHLNKSMVTMGQKVSRGDVIGTVGVTGRTTGSHLHFEVRVNGVVKNPLNYLD